MEDSLSDLISNLQHTDPIQRSKSLDALAELNTPKHRALFYTLLKDPDWVICFKAACALAWVGDTAGLEILTKALTQRDLCFIALQALYQLGAPESLPALRSFYARRFINPLERMQAAAAMVRAGDDHLVGWIESGVNSKRAEERGFALELIGRLGLSGAFEKLKQTVLDQKSPHRLDAFRGLYQLEDSRCLTLFEQLADDQDDPELAFEAGQAIKEINSQLKDDHART